MGEITDKRSSNGFSRHAENLRLRVSELYLRLYFGANRFISVGWPIWGGGRRSTPTFVMMDRSFSRRCSCLWV